MNKGIDISITYHLPKLNKYWFDELVSPIIETVV